MGTGLPTGWVALICAVIMSLILLIGYGVRQIVKGNLLPRAYLDEKKQDFQDRLDREREISNLQAATQANLVEATRKTSEQLELLVAEQKTTREVMNALRTAGELAAKAGGS